MLNSSFSRIIQLLRTQQKRGSEEWIKWDPNCSIYRNEELHAIMDRVCEMCHEMFSHEQTNLRAECRKNCFRNKKFRGCLQLFSPAEEGWWKDHH
ncbi:unnamed protein product [Dracunculus medinensis]|uniref:Zf-Tim10_DDP domain-containing protein n=1 Tax=Dracunculus medinensis TaxID=318479 RepID=A0A0N4U9U6_DRAME|nr:unnamed protein product [Dracunculus medinensis]